jgi:hypothetical protein
MALKNGDSIAKNARKTLSPLSLHARKAKELLPVYIKPVNEITDREETQYLEEKYIRSKSHRVNDRKHDQSCNKLIIFNYATHFEVMRLLFFLGFFCQLHRGRMMKTIGSHQSRRLTGNRDDHRLFLIEIIDTGSINHHPYLQKPQEDLVFAY